MVKKISYILISAAIVVTGFIAFNRLNFLDRSVWIFKISNSDQAFEGRPGRGRGEFNGRQQPGNQIGFEQREGRGGAFERDVMREMPDSLRGQFRRNEQVRTEGAPQTKIGVRGADRHGRGEFPGGKKLYLKNVLWFTAAFAFFTVIVIYLDKIFSIVLYRIKKSGQK